MAKTISENGAGGLSVLQALLKSGNPELIHRAAVAIRKYARVCLFVCVLSFSRRSNLVVTPNTFPPL